jgi:prepilin-type N-terminal cleavage/methylation domain-containing protein
MSPKRLSGFTLIEILFVIVIVSLLAAIILTVTFSVRKRSNDTVCISQLRQIGAAIRMYQSDYEELPHELKDIYPAYLTDKRVFRCPEWENVAAAEGQDSVAKIKTMLTMYTYQPAERRFWQSVPSEPGDPPSLKTGWQEAYEKRGEMLPLITCQFHDPLLLNKEMRSNPKFDKMGMTRIVLRLDGSVEKTVAHRKGRGISWYDL